VYCIDASVLIAIFDETDAFHDTSFRMFDFVMQRGTNVIIPAFALVEVAGALVRKGYEQDDVVEYLDYLKSCKNIEFILLTIDLYELAISVALQLKVKGSDSMYIAVSSFYNLTLVTYDDQQKDRGKKMIETTTPNSVYSGINL
jgi:predicted nucleic acid-binding protein